MKREDLIKVTFYHPNFTDVKNEALLSFMIQNFNDDQIREGIEDAVSLYGLDLVSIVSKIVQNSIYDIYDDFICEEELDNEFEIEFDADEFLFTCESLEDYIGCDYRAEDLRTELDNYNTNIQAWLTQLQKENEN